MVKFPIRTIFNRRVEFSLLTLSILIALYSACRLTKESPSGSEFQIFCNNYQFMTEKDKARSRRLANDVRDGRISPDHDLSLGDIDIHATVDLSGRHVADSQCGKIVIKKYVILERGEPIITMSMPVMRKRAPIFSINMPPYREVTCADIRNAIFYQFAMDEAAK